MTERRPRPIYGIFEGGGAKGVGHVAAAAAAQEIGLEFVGVAGTSAGALVASLLAVGYSPTDLLNDLSTSPLLTRYGLTPIHFFGGDRMWRKFCRLQRAVENPILQKLLLCFGVIVAILRHPRLTWKVSRSIIERGYFQTDPIAEFIDKSAYDKLRIIATEGEDTPTPTQPITFGDLAPDKYSRDVLPLKIVAADVTTGNAEVFDSLRKSHIELGKAVAASMAIPLIFAPSLIEGHLFVDGGLVSNLPFWVFSEEKLAYERRNGTILPLIAFTLQDSKAVTDERTRPGFLSFLKSVLRTGVFGSQSVFRSFVDDLLVVHLPSSLNLLQFGASKREISEAYDMAKEAALLQLRTSFIWKPNAFRTIIETIQETAHERGNIAHMRARWLEPFGSHLLRATHIHDLERDIDRTLLFDRRGHAGIPLRSKKPEIFQINVLRDDMTPQERAILRSSLRSAIVFPVFASTRPWEISANERPDPTCLLYIDSDQDRSIYGS